MRRGPVVVNTRRGPGLMGTMAKTAVIAGTATVTAKAVSGAMNSGSQQKAAAQQQATDQQQQMADLQTQQAELAAQQQALAATASCRATGSGRCRVEQLGRPTGADSEALGDERPGLAQ